MPKFSIRRVSFTLTPEQQMLGYLMSPIDVPLPSETRKLFYQMVCIDDFPVDVVGYMQRLDSGEGYPVIDGDNLPREEIVGHLCGPETGVKGAAIRRHPVTSQTYASSRDASGSYTGFRMVMEKDGKYGKLEGCVYDYLIEIDGKREWIRLEACSSLDEAIARSMALGWKWVGAA